MEQTMPAMAVEEATDESALLTALRSGEAAAFEQLVRTQMPRLLATARRILPNEDDAREAVQDAFLSAFRNIGQFSGQARISTWLHRIVVNAALAKRRRRHDARECSIDDLLPRFLGDGHQAQPAVEWREPAEAALQREETRHLVRGAIGQLPEAFRTVLVLRDIEGLETGEAAGVLGVTTGVVKTRLHRARQALRTLLDPHFRESAC